MPITLLALPEEVTFPGWAGNAFSSFTQSPNDKPVILVVPFRLQRQATTEDQEKNEIKMVLL